MKSIGFYLGSFNPPHMDHDRLIRESLDRGLVSKVCIVPAYNHPNKKNLVPFSQRCAWLSQLYDGSNYTEVLRLEKLNESGRTYDLMTMIRKIWTNDDIHIICGADLLNAFESKWYKGSDFIKENKFIVYARDKVVLKTENDNIQVISDVDTKNLSSSFIRDNIKDITTEHVHPIIIEDVRKYYLKNAQHTIS